MDEIEGQDSLDQIVEIKLHSFYHYLKRIKFTGFGKWVILS
jgi:hypothetical protein